MSKPKIYEEFHEELERRVAEAVQAIEDAQVGEVFAWPTNSREPHRGLLCNGAAVSRTTYSKLFEAIGTTYGTGDGSTTFNLPNMTNRFIQGSGKAGTVKAAGLPNIWGYVGANLAETITADGAFSYASSWANNLEGDSSGFEEAGGNLDFFASRVNGIYGASNTVQPPALTMRFYIKY